MLTQSLVAGFSLLVFGALTSCSSDLGDTPVMSKLRAQQIAGKQNATNPFLPQPASDAVVNKARSMPKDKHGMPTYRNHSDRTRYVRMTAYSHMENEPGAPGRMNAAGGILKYGSVRSAAADWSVYPLGTMFKIKGLPHTYVVDDYGSALVGTNTIDIFKPSLSKMRKWGTRKSEITVVQWGSYERSLRLLKGRTRYNHCRRMYFGCKRKLNSRVVSRDIRKNGAL